MGWDVAAELEYDLGMRPEGDLSRGAADELAADVDPERRLRGEPADPVGFELLAPDAEDLGEAEAGRDADDPVGAVRAHRIAAAVVRDPDAGRHDDDLAVDEDLEMDPERRPGRAAVEAAHRGAGDDGCRPCRQRVLRHRADGPREHPGRQRGSECQDGSHRGNGLLTRTGSSKSCRKLSTAAAAPPATASTHSRRVAVPGRRET